MRRSRLIASLAGAALMALGALAVAACGGAPTTASAAAIYLDTDGERVERRVGDSRRREERPRVDPGRLSRQDAVPVAGRHRGEELLQRRLCRGLASALDDLGADPW